MVIAPHLLQGLLVAKGGPVAQAATTGPSFSGGFSEAAQESDSRSYIPWYYFSEGGGSSESDRKMHASIARYIVANFTQASYAVGTIARYSAPVYPQASSIDDAWNSEFQDIFDSWAKICDYSGRFDLWRMQLTASQLIDTDGMVAFWARNKDGIPKVSMIEEWQIRTPNSKRKDLLCVDGVQWSPDGVVTGYWVNLMGEHVFIPANEMIILCHPTRYSNNREDTPMRQGVNDLRDAHDIKGYEKRGVKMTSAHSLIYKQNPDSADATGWKTRQTTEQKANGVATADILPGAQKTISTLDDIVQLKSDRPGQQVMEFLAKLVGDFVQSLQIPPAFFLDEKLTGPNTRGVIGKAQRRFDERQDLFCSLLDWLWPRVIANRAVAGGAKSFPVGWEKIAYIFPPKATIDAGRDSANEREDVANLLMSRRNSFGNRGMDWRPEIAQAIRERKIIIQQAKEAAQELGVSVELFLGAKDQPAQQVQKPEEPTDPEDNKKKEGEENE